MNRLVGWVGLGIAILSCCLLGGSPRAGAEEKKGAVVDFDGLKSAAPVDWKEEEPSTKMRYKQFRLPKVGEDKADAELQIFRGFGGSAKENVKRWKGQFLPPEGKKIDDVAKVSEMKVAGADVTYLDVNGVYLFKARPIDPDEKAERRPGYRMLAVHFEGPKNIYHIKLVGPAKTIEHYKKGFDEWLKAFK
jgi:hypothetical protein